MNRRMSIQSLVAFVMAGLGISHQPVVAQERAKKYTKSGIRCGEVCRPLPMAVDLKHARIFPAGNGTNWVRLEVDFDELCSALENNEVQILVEDASHILREQDNYFDIVRDTCKSVMTAVAGILKEGKPFKNTLCTLVKVEEK